MEDFLTPYGICPNERQMTHYKIEKKAFFHFGVNTFTDREWGNGTEVESVFNPVGCDCEQWIKAIKNAGFKLAVITAKHHDGFCLWPSEYTTHSVKNSPYKNGNGDIIKEFTDACRKYGIRVGIYISPWDRNAPFWGEYDYNYFFNNQLTELLTNYGEIDEVWWDGAGSAETPYNWEMWATTVRALQPNAVMFGSRGATPYVEMRWVGNEQGFAGKPCFGTISTKCLEVEGEELFNGTPDGDKFAIAEVDVSVRPGWFYHENQNTQIKSAQEIVNIWFNSVGSNCNMLLNIPPDKTGHITKEEIENITLANNYIEAALSQNLLQNAEIKCTSKSFKKYNVENIISENDCFFASTEYTFTIDFTLPFKANINMFKIEEVIELGHRVRGFNVQIFANGEYVTVFDGKCIGYKWAECFDTYNTDKIRLIIYDAKATPLIRNFGVYYIDENAIKSAKTELSGTDLSKLTNSRITYSDNSVEVEFGGIYPFNYIYFSSNVNNYDIEAFDGSVYKTIFSKANNCSILLREPVTGSYKMRIVTKEKVDKNSVDIKIINKIDG